MKKIALWFSLLFIHMRLSAKEESYVEVKKGIDQSKKMDQKFEAIFEGKSVESKPSK